MPIVSKYNAIVMEGTTAELEASTTVYKSNILLCDTETGGMRRGNGVDVYSDLPESIGEAGPQGPEGPQGPAGADGSDADVTFANVSSLSGNWSGTGADTLTNILTDIETRLAAVES